MTVLGRRQRSSRGAAENAGADFPWVGLALGRVVEAVVAQHELVASTGPGLCLARCLDPCRLLQADTEVLVASLDHIVDLSRNRLDVGMAGCQRSFPTR